MSLKDLRHCINGHSISKFINDNSLGRWLEYSRLFKLLEFMLFDGMDCYQDPRRLERTFSMDLQPYDISEFSDEVITRPEGLPRKYTLRELLSRGHSNVYLAENVETRDDVIIKSYLDEENDSFGREVECFAAVNSKYHPNVVNLLDFFPIISHLVLSYANRGSLEDLIEREKGLDVVPTFLFTFQICKGLQHTHNSGIIHRDVKPGNVVLDISTLDEEELKSYQSGKKFGVLTSKNKLVVPKVSDFGLGYYPGCVEDIECIVGSLAYMSPEAFHKPQKDPRVDIYALGISIYQMLTNEVPFDGNTSEIYQQKKDMGLLNHERIPKKIMPVIKTACERRLQNRYQSMTELAEDFERRLYRK
jgi:eukaryotic-like serine/threonine-protein kinase